MPSPSICIDPSQKKKGSAAKPHKNNLTQKPPSSQAGPLVPGKFFFPTTDHRKSCRALPRLCTRASQAAVGQRAPGGFSFKEVSYSMGFSQVFQQGCFSGVIFRSKSCFYQHPKPIIGAFCWFLYILKPPKSTCWRV